MASQEWWEQKEKEYSDAQSKKDQAEQDAANQRSESLQEAARAMDKVKGFGNKLGGFYASN